MKRVLVALLIFGLPFVASADVTGVPRVQGVANGAPLNTLVGVNDSGNSSTATLTANATFTGAWFDAYNWMSVQVFAYSNVSSTPNGVVLQFSADGTNPDETYATSFVAGGTALNELVSMRGRYFRLLYTNGPAAQSTFRLQVTYKAGAGAGDIVEVNDPITPTDHAQLVRLASTTGTPDGVVTGTINGACADGTINSCGAGTTVQITMNGAAGCGAFVPSSTTLVGTVKADYSMDGLTWVNTAWVDYTGVGSASTTVASGGTYSLSAALNSGARFCRVRADTRSGGSANVTVITTMVPSVGNAVSGMGSAGAPSGGVVSVQGVNGGTAVRVAGTGTPADAYANPGDAHNATAFNMGWNGATWDRLSIEGNNNDAEATTATGHMSVENYNMLFNGTTWDRARGSAAAGAMIYPTSTAVFNVAGTGTPADAVNNPGNANFTEVFPMGWNGATWDRNTSGANNADGVAVATRGNTNADAFGYQFNGTTWDRLRGTAAGGLLTTPTSTATASNTGTCTAVTTSNTLMAAKTTRIGAMVTSISTNTVRARYAFNTTATATQMPLEPGQSVSLGPDYKGAVSFISESGASITICVTEW